MKQNIDSYPSQITDFLNCLENQCESRGLKPNINYGSASPLYLWQPIIIQVLDRQKGGLSGKKPEFWERRWEFTPSNTGKPFLKNNVGKSFIAGYIYQWIPLDIPEMDIILGNCRTYSNEQLISELLR